MTRRRKKRAVVVLGIVVSPECSSGKERGIGDGARRDVEEVAEDVVDAEGVGGVPRAEAVEGRPAVVGERKRARKDLVAEVQRVARHATEIRPHDSRFEL